MPDHVRSLRVRVGRGIRRTRESLGLTQEALAARTPHQPKLIGMVERGEANVGLDVLASIVAALGVDIADIVAPPQGRGVRLVAITGAEHKLLQSLAAKSQPLRRVRPSQPRD